MKPRFSIMMPAFNSSRFIVEAIKSVMAQTLEDWELVIVDDASTDGTYDLVVEIAKQDSRIHVHRNDHNLGIPANRKKSRSFMVGEFFTHLDHDDLIRRYALAELDNVFTKRPEVALVYSDVIQIGQRGEIQLYNSAKDFNPSRLCDHGWRHMGAYRSRILNCISGYNDQIPTCEDGDLFMQIAEKFVCYHHPDALYLYREHPDQHSKKTTECKTCEYKMKCNYLRVWCKSAMYDQSTFLPIKPQPIITH